MKHVKRFDTPKFLSICVAFGLLFSFGCGTENPKPGGIAQANSSTVYVVFEGPWAFVSDPADSSKVIAIAPKAKNHTDAYVKAMSGIMLLTGVYELHVPSRATSMETPPPLAAADGSVKAQALTDALNNKNERFAIYLPK